MRCPKCTERNSVAARKCAQCGEKFKRKALPMGVKLAAGGALLAVTIGVAASYVVPKFVDPEQNLARVARRVAAGPTSPEDATKIKKDFSNAIRTYLKDNGTAKTSELATGLTKLLPSSAYEVHVAELPRGIRVIEIDTVLQPSDYLLMSTTSGIKVFDLPGFGVFDDGKILNDTAGPVLALIGHTGGPPPHHPMVRTYALLPDYVSDESDKLVPALKGDGQAKFAANGQDIQLQLTKTSSVKGQPSETNYGLLVWKDAKYTSDFSNKTAKQVHHKFDEPVVSSAPPAPPAVQTPAQPVESKPAAAPAVATQPQIPSNRRMSDKTAKLVAAAAPVLAGAATRATSGKHAKIVVRGLTDAPVPVAVAAGAGSEPVAGAALAAAMPPPAVAGSRPIRPAVNVTQTPERAVPPRTSAPAQQISAPKTAVAVPAESHKRHHGDSSHSYALVSVSGATLRAHAHRGAAAMGALSHGARVEVLSKEDSNWYRVKYNGSEGYVYGSLLQMSGNDSAPEKAVASNTGSGSSSTGSRHHRHRHGNNTGSTMLVADVSQHHAQAESSTSSESSHGRHRRKHRHHQSTAAAAPVEEAPNQVP